MYKPRASLSVISVLNPHQVQYSSYKTNQSLYNIHIYKDHINTIQIIIMNNNHNVNYMHMLL